MVDTLILTFTLLLLSAANFSQPKVNRPVIEMSIRLKADSIRYYQSLVFYQQHKAIIELSK